MCLRLLRAVTVVQAVPHRRPVRASEQSSPEKLFTAHQSGPGEGVFQDLAGGAAGMWAWFGLESWGGK